MTFLSVTPDTFDIPAAAARPDATRRRLPRGTLLCAGLAMSLVLTLPGAVIQAKWTRLQLVVTILQHRCIDGLSS